MTLTLFYALAFTPGLTPTLAYALLTHFGSAQAIFAATVDQLTQVPGISADLATRLLAAPVDDYATEIAALTQSGLHALYPYKDPYPINLRHTPTPPLVLFTRGKPIPVDLNAVAILGGRQPTPAALELSTHLARGLADRGLTVVTSLNRGIDITALRAALAIGGRAFAVLNHGLQAPVHPPEHADILPELAWQGAILTPFRPADPAAAPNNPVRDAVILGLSRALILPFLDPDDPRSLLPDLATHTHRLVLTPTSFDPAALDTLAESILSHAIQPT